MTEREVSELRRRFRADKSNITHVHGCYVNSRREIISEFDQSVALLGEEESEMLLTTLRKTLSGQLGRNLMDIPFTTAQVADSDEHRLLSTLRNTQLKDPNSRRGFYEKAIRSLNIEGNYLILLAYDAYDVPYRSRDGEGDEGQNNEVFRYILCSICPVKLTKAALSFSMQENSFGHLNPDWAIGAPETGFLFPAFDDRATNLYNALYYTKDPACTQSAFAAEVFRTQPPMPATEQKESFQSVLADTLEEACSYEVVHAVHDKLCELMEEHKANKIPEPLAVSKETVGQILRQSGVEEGRVEAFEEGYEEVFGGETALPPRNLFNAKQMEITLPEVTIHVNSERTNLVSTRVIDGGRYILIRAEDEVSVNGVPITIK